MYSGQYINVSNKYAKNILHHTKTMENDYVKCRKLLQTTNLALEELNKMIWGSY